MRNVACEKWVQLADDPNFVFLTGDLGFMALEPLQKVLGRRFINAGIAEQNMLSVACGLAIEGLNPWYTVLRLFVTQGLLSKYEMMYACTIFQ